MKRWAWCLVVIGCSSPTPEDPVVDAARPDLSVDFAVDAAPDSTADGAPPDSAPDVADAARDAGPLGDLGVGQVPVRVTLDGEPAADTLVVQGGTSIQRRTDASGRVNFPVNYRAIGQILLIASHPEARQGNVEIFPDEAGERTIALRRFGPINPAYIFQDPGEPDRRASTAQCGHCHLRMNDAWFASPHRSSARNPVVHDLYSGTAANVALADCAARGGRVQMARLPGGGTGERCFLGDGALPALNDCDGPCPTPTDTGHCADCHAPGIDGEIGGRDLLEARERSFRHGVHCDICHRVESVNPEGGPGVSGRLRLHRPSEASPSIGLGQNLPLTFGPSHDSPNPRMGSVQRDHFRDGSLCGGCHELTQPSNTPRWPDGLPVQSTYEEWRTGVLAEATRCPSCHMPPDPLASNGGDLQAFPLADLGIQGGWPRPAGAVRQHSWVGPRQPKSRMLQLAAALFVNKTQTAEGWSVEVSTRNVAAGHAIPTGEPMRQMILTVRATCGDEPLVATGGDVVPEFVGALQVKRAGEDWASWPGAEPGDRIRVVRREGFHDYPAFGRIDDFDPPDKGLPVDVFAGESVVSEVAPLVLEPPLADGDLAYLVRGAAPAAGQPGFAFARVLAAEDGRLMVPHFVATDLTSDNRLMPQARWTSRHAFGPCPDPQIEARLWYRRYPDWLARERAWDNSDVLMVEVFR